MTRDHRIAVIPGDGIGPEIVRGAVAVLRQVACDADFALDVVEVTAGAGQYLATGTALSSHAWEVLSSDVDGILKGPAGLPDVRCANGTEAGMLGGVLRRGLDLFANVRPARLLPGVRSALHAPASIDYVVIRENTEGLYASRGGGIRTQATAVDTLLMTRHGVERIARFAFETARGRLRDTPGIAPRVTCVDKANVLQSYAFFREIVSEVTADYPDVTLDHLHADAAAAALVLSPDAFDVLVMENFVGDILSDLAAATIGGLGMCYTANIGAQHAYFEPCHGSAPSLAGQNRANPIAQVLSAAELLEYLGETTAARRVHDGVARALIESVDVAPDGTVPAGTDRVIEAILAHLPSTSGTDA